MKTPDSKQALRDLCSDAKLNWRDGDNNTMIVDQAAFHFDGADKLTRIISTVDTEEAEDRADEAEGELSSVREDYNELRRAALAVLKAIEHIGGIDAEAVGELTSICDEGEKD